MISIITVIVAYLMSALSPSIIISKKVLGNDIRNLGSKNAGTTNAIRTMGKKWGAIVFALDILKVVIAYLIIYLITSIFGKLPLGDINNSLFVLASVLGHTFPIYYGFKGGKGVAVYLASCLLVDYKLALVCFVVGIIIIAITRWVSLASICGSILAVIISFFMDTSLSPIILILASALVVYNHRANITRILAGTESKLFSKKEGK